MSSKRKEKEKKKKRERKRMKIATLCLETRARFEGFMEKANWLGATDLVFATRVDGWSLVSCR